MTILMLPISPVISNSFSFPCPLDVKDLGVSTIFSSFLVNLLTYPRVLEVYQLAVRITTHNTHDLHTNLALVFIMHAWTFTSFPDGTTKSA